MNSQLTPVDVLIVDDTPANLDVLMAMLQSSAYRIRVATGGKRALGAVAAQLPDVMLLDISMPDIDGYEVCRRLRLHPAAKHLPIIFLSAHDDASDKVAAFRAGGTDYVAKPFQVEEVLARIEHHVTMRRLRDELERRNVELEQRNRELQSAQQATRDVFMVLADVLPGMVLDERYRLDMKIGSGGFGAVYSANHLPLDRAVAVKVLLPQSPGGANANQLLQREGMSASRVNHPNAVSVLDFGVTSSGISYLVFELLDGRTLERELARRKRLSIARCCEILAPVAAVLEVAHASGILHRDIKPSNIFLHRDGTREVVKVLDFGIARSANANSPGVPTATVAGVAGTPPYMAPERLRDQDGDASADIFSFGVMMYQMLSGSLPWALPPHSTPLSYAFEIVNGQPVPITEHVDLPGGLAALVMQALSRDPRERPPLATLVRALAGAAGQA